MNARTLLVVWIVGGCSASSGPVEPTPEPPCLVDVTAPEDAAPAYVPRVVPAYDFDQPEGPWPGAVVERRGPVDWRDEWPLTLCDGEPLPPGGSVLLENVHIQTQLDVEELRKYRAIWGISIRPIEPLDVYLPELFVTHSIDFSPMDSIPVRVRLPHLTVVRELNLVVPDWNSPETLFEFDELCAASQVYVVAYYREPIMPALRTVRDLEYWSVTTDSLRRLERAESARIVSVDLSGLAALEEVDKSLSLNISHAATSFASPPRLRQVGVVLQLNIQHNGQAEDSLLPFQGLEYVSEYVSIYTTQFMPLGLFPALKYVKGGIRTWAPTLTSRLPSFECALKQGAAGSPYVEVVDCATGTGPCCPACFGYDPDLWWPEE